MDGLTDGCVDDFKLNDTVGIGVRRDVDFEVGYWVGLSDGFFVGCRVTTG